MRNVYLQLRPQFASCCVEYAHQEDTWHPRQAKVWSRINQATVATRNADYIGRQSEVVAAEAPRQRLIVADLTTALLAAAGASNVSSLHPHPLTPVALTQTAMKQCAVAAVELWDLAPVGTTGPRRM